MRGILIDVEAKVVREVDIDGGLASMRASIQCDLIECIQLSGSNDLWIDEEGLLGVKTSGFIMEGMGHPIIGNGLILGHDGNGDSAASSLEVSLIEYVTTFVDYDNLDDRPTPDIQFVAWDDDGEDN